MKTINQIAQEIQNVQIYPSTTRVEPNDKVTKLTFNFNAETYEELITGDGFGVIETKRHKKFGEITSSFKIRSIYNEPLTEFDRAVLAHQGVHRAGAKLQLRVIQRLDAGKLLFDVQHLQQILMFGHDFASPLFIKFVETLFPERGLPEYRFRKHSFRKPLLTSNTVPATEAAGTI